VSRNATAVADFEREIRGELDGLFRRDVPNAVVGLALELAQQIEDNAPVGTRAYEPGPGAKYRGAPYRRRPGTLKSRVIAGKVLQKAASDLAGSGGGATARATALADWKIGEPILVVVDAYYASFVENGTEKMAARPFVRPALEAVGNREVRV
jgi:HK97 gp10 family phage protein